MDIFVSGEAVFPICGFQVKNHFSFRLGHFLPHRSLEARHTRRVQIVHSRIRFQEIFFPMDRKRSIRRSVGTGTDRRSEATGVGQVSGEILLPQANIDRPSVPVGHKDIENNRSKIRHLHFHPVSVD